MDAYAFSAHNDFRTRDLERMEDWWADVRLVDANELVADLLR